MANMKLNGMTLDQLADRRRLLTSFDKLPQELDATGAVRGMDAATERALGVLTSSKLLDALDCQPGTRKGPRPLRRRQAVQVPVRRRPDGQRSTADGPPAGRGRRPRA